LIRHLRPAPLPRPQHLQPVPIDLALPAVVARAVDPERPAGSRHPDPPGKREQLQPVAEQHVILRHATPPSLLGGEEASLSRKADGAPKGRRLASTETSATPTVAGPLGDRPR